VKIAVVYHQLIGQGGLENYLLEFVRALVAAGHDVHAVTAVADDMGRAAGARIHILPGGRPKTSAKLRGFDRKSADFIDTLGADIVLGFGRTTRQDIHRAGGGCHRVYSRMLSPLKRWRPKNRAELSLEETLYTGGGTRHFVVNSEMVARQLEREYSVPRGNVTVIPTAVDIEKHSRGEPSRLPGENPVFLFVSREHRRKGLRALLEAFAGVPGRPELWIAGPPLDRGFRGQVDRLGVGARIRELGGEGDLVDAYRSADVFVHPTLYDACANTVLQSMACGLPGIVSARDGAAEYIDDGVNGWRLEDPEGVQGLREMLVRAIDTSSERRMAMGEAARARVSGNTWETHVGDWLELISRIT